MLDLDGSLFGHTSIQLVCVKYTDGITNATFGIVWCLAGKWSPSIVCLPDTGMSCPYNNNFVCCVERSELKSEIQNYYMKAQGVPQ